MTKNFHKLKYDSIRSFVNCLQTSDIFPKLLWKEYEDDISSILARIKSSSWILDVGCGIGHTTSIFNLEGMESIGVDVMCHTKIWKNFRVTFGGEMLVADGCFLPFRDEFFDAVTLFGVLHAVALRSAHSEDDFIKEMNRVLKKMVIYLLTIYHESSLLESFSASHWDMRIKKEDID